MKSTKNQKISNALIKVWKNRREDMMQPRIKNQDVIRQQQSERIKQHYKEHPEHRTAISQAQKHKWQTYKKALAYCKNAGLNLEVD